MKGKFILLALIWLLAVPLILLVHTASAGDMSFLSFDSPEMIAFDFSFKQYIASYKKFVEKEKGLRALDKAISQWNTLSAKAEKQSAGEGVFGRMTVVRGLLLQAQGLARQDRLDEAGELSVPIRSEIYEMHKALNMLTAEDYMIFFHNGVMHRAEPLIKEGRYLELKMLIPLIEETVNKFKNPPKSATDVKQYNKRYGSIIEMVNAFITAIRQVNEHVDPEYGAYMLGKKIENAYNDVHKKFGALYLSFPESMVWPKKKK